VRAWASDVAADVRTSWWTPQSLPTVRQAWNGRIPDPDRVPGGHRGLRVAWLAYNSTAGVAIPAVVALIVGALTALVWAARHPARLLLTVLIVIPVVVLAAS
jgi:RES domain-containing protein